MEEREKQYWLHRITGGDNGSLLSRRLLREHNMLSTGWSDFSTRDDLSKIKEKHISAIEELMYTYWEWSEEEPLPRNRYCLNNFVNEMKSGDIVVVPLDKYVSIYKLVDNTIFTNDNIRQRFLDEANIQREERKLYSSKGETIDLGFYRKAEPLALNIPRAELCAELYKKTRSQKTNINISDVDSEIELLIRTQTSGKECTKPIDYIHLVESIKQYTDNISDDKSFEERIQNVFIKMSELMRNGVLFLYGKPNSKKNQLLIPYVSIEDDIYDNITIVEKVVAAYLRGDVFSSIKDLNEWWDEHKDSGFPYAPIHKNYVYYRTRLKGDGDKVVFDEKDLFHVPFNKRGSVTTKRYSLPGYPCLYLGKSIYVCWEEMRRPALSDFATSALKAQADFYLLDLRLRKIMYTEENCRLFIKMLPIILACSLRVVNEDDNFKPEYILPQLLLHIIIVKSQNEQEIEGENNKKIRLSGIEYTSTAIYNDFDFVNSDSVTTYYYADCIVVPVRISEKTSNKYCEDLARKFLITKPKYYENEYIKDSLAFIREYISSLTNNQNKKENFVKKYDTSYFSYMEKSWKQSDFKSINVK